VYVFVLDVSYVAVSSGVLAAACAAIKASLRDIPGGERTLVALITHDTAVNFYAFKKGGKPPSAFVVSDIGVPNAGGGEGAAPVAPGDELFLPALPEVRGICGQARDGGNNRAALPVLTPLTYTHTHTHTHSHTQRARPAGPPRAPL
jgi:hypothetical protein